MWLYWRVRPEIIAVLLIAIVGTMMVHGHLDEFGTWLNVALYIFALLFGLLMFLAVGAVILYLILGLLHVVAFVLRLWNRSADRSLDSLDAERARRPDSRS